MKRRVLLALLPLILACDDRQTFRTIEPGWERMMTQPRVDPYAKSDFFADGLAMRRPPDGTVAWRDGRAIDPEAERGSRADGSWLDRVPLAVTDETIATGRVRFDQTCATCHGVLGDADTPVADAMRLRRAPSLHEARIRAYPVGRVYGAIRDGYGLMPSYRAALSVEERWAVVEYVQALQLARGARAEDLSPQDLAALDRGTP